MKKFAILTQQRTGSNFLVGLLNSHPDVRCLSELFIKDSGKHRGRIDFLQKLDVVFHPQQYRIEHWRDYIAAIIAHYGDKPCFGFKLMLNQGMSVAEAIIHDPTYAVIVLHRENALAAYSSNLIAMATGQGIAHTDTVIMKHRPTFDAKHFRRWQKRSGAKFNRMKATLEQSGRPYVELEYLDVPKRETHQAIFSHLGIRRDVELTSDHKKRNASNIIERFSNPEEVERELSPMEIDAWALEVASNGQLR